MQTESQKHYLKFGDLNMVSYKSDLYITDLQVHSLIEEYFKGSDGL